MKQSIQNSIQEVKKILKIERSYPSVEYRGDDGFEKVIWRLKDKVIHRDFGPAIINTDGFELWVKNGVWHREDGPARTFPSGKQEWWINGMLHRTNGPAIEYETSHYYYLFDQQVNQWVVNWIPTICLPYFCRVYFHFKKN
jgi:hypothetical protein